MYLMYTNDVTTFLPEIDNEFNYNEIFEAKVNIKLKEPLKMSSPSSFNSVLFTNGKSGAKIDLLKLLVVSPLLQDIVLSLGVPISWLEDLNIIVPEISWNSLALFKSFVEEASIAKIPTEDCHELLSTLAIFGNSTFAEQSSESEDIDDETNFVNECDRIPELCEVDSILSMMTATVQPGTIMIMLQVITTTPNLLISWRIFFKKSTES